jgi:ABC-2 type transport system ATP-binding protein
MAPSPLNSPVPESPLDGSAPRSRAVEACAISKVYRTGFWLNQTVPSLQGVSLDVAEGETFGLLGPNGAGKTTLLKILLGIARPSAGGGTVLGRPLGDRAAKQRLGYLPENAYFYDHLTGWEYLEFAAAIYKLPTKVAQARIGELLDWVQLDRAAAKNKPMRQYSKGMLQRVGMAQALIGNPDLIFLDEPMSGLDPLGRHQIREIILTLKEQGKTIFFNSHILSDVEKICDRVAILHRGQLLQAGSLDDLLGRKEGYRVQGTGGDRAALEPWLTALEFEHGRWHGRFVGDVAALADALGTMGATLDHLDRDRPSLEDFFVQAIRTAQRQP